MKILEKEIKFFKIHEGDYKKSYMGKFVLIKGEELKGVFDNQETAYKEGVKLYGDDPFLIRQVLSDRTVHALPSLWVGTSIDGHF